MLLAYDAGGEVVGTLDYMVARDAAGDVVGLIDFEAQELAGGEMTDVWTVSSATGSKTWPEWIGSRAHDFRVELVGPPGNKRISALVHKVSGQRRERTAIEAELARRTKAAKGEPVDARDLLGGPDRPLILDEQGRTVGRSEASGTPAHLPILGRPLP